MNATETPSGSSLDSLGSAPAPTFIAERSSANFELTEAEKHYLEGLLLWQEQSSKCQILFDGSEKAPNDRGQIGPSSDDYEQWLACQPTLVAAFASGQFKLPDGYQVWRHAWLACETAHGIRPNYQAQTPPP